MCRFHRDFLINSGLFGFFFSRFTALTRSIDKLTNICKLIRGISRTRAASLYVRTHATTPSQIIHVMSQCKKKKSHDAHLGTTGTIYRYLPSVHRSWQREWGSSKKKKAFAMSRSSSSGTGNSSRSSIFNGQDLSVSASRKRPAASSVQAHGNGGFANMRPVVDAQGINGCLVYTTYCY